MNEKQLITACQEGIKSAQYELVKRYSGMLMSVCRRYVRDESTAKDILQESLIRIFKNIDGYKRLGSFEGWMRKITVRCALGHLDKKHVRRESSVADINSDETTMPLALDNLGVEDIIKLVQDLPPGFRSVFNLNVIEGYNHREISEMLGITESASRSQLTRARQLLQKKYTKINAKYKSA